MGSFAETYNDPNIVSVVNIISHSLETKITGRAF